MAPDAIRNPWDAPFPAFSYSESQDQRRRRCARAHYHAVYTAHRGWAAKPGTNPWIAYRLKSASPLAAAVGSAVHVAATTCVRALTSGGELPRFDRLRAEAGSTLNTLWRNSQARQADFLRAPKRVPVYLESLYGDGPSRSRLHRAAQSLDGALWTLLQCDEVWEWVRSAQKTDVILMDPFTSMALEDDFGKVTCYGAADLIVRPSANDPWHILDFKTGAADGVVDQIMTYALIAKSVLGISVEEGCRGVVVALGEHPSRAIGSFAIDSADLLDASVRIRTSVASARALLADASANEPLPIEAFPMSKEPRTCAMCSFRTICHPDTMPARVGLAGPARVAA